MSAEEMVMERDEWLMDEDKLQGRRTFVLTILDEAGMPQDVIEGIDNIVKEIEKYGGVSRGDSKGKVSNRR